MILLILVSLQVLINTDNLHYKNLIRVKMWKIGLLKLKTVFKILTIDWTLLTETHINFCKLKNKWQKLLVSNKIIIHLMELDGCHTKFFTVIELNQNTELDLILRFHSIEIRHFSKLENFPKQNIIINTCDRKIATPTIDKQFLIFA